MRKNCQVYDAMKILIIRFTALGDLVTLEPTFRAFRYFFKEAKITLLTSSFGKGLYEDSDYFDDYVVHKNFWTTVKLLRKEHFDLVINLQCNKPSHYINLLLHKDQTINKSFNLFQKIFHIKTHSKNIQEMLLCANVAQDAIASYFQHPENDTILLPPYKDKIKSTCHRIALSTGSSERWKSKQWGVENYCDLIQKLSQQGIKITLVGSKLEADDATYIQNRIPTVLNFVGKTSLGELKNILHSVDLYIGNDSGPTHIAAGVGTDTLTIFGSTGIKHCPAFEKYKGVHLYIKPDSSIACHPCYKGVCPTQHECMKNISVETVFSKIIEHLKGQK